MLDKFQKLINIPVFIASLAVGLFFAYVTMPKQTTIFVYPNPLMKNKVQYRDAADNCFEYEEAKVECPLDKTKIHSIPVQT
tara:strand:- start:451 stop:693 length:243 start_codon:yes stop_codon:yes gene_type:complete